MNTAKRLALLSRLRDANPSPTTELEYRTPYELLVAVALSAQATDVSVNKVTKRLFQRANTPKTMVELGEEEVREYIKSIGLFRGKAKNVVAASQMLIDRHDSEVPQNRESLEALPGVGRKTANVILNTAFGQPTIAVDTHIFRVSNRTGLAPGKTVRKVEDRLLKVVPAEFKTDVHHWLILHGRYVCTARKPHCADCTVADVCDYKSKTG